MVTIGPAIDCSEPGARNSNRLPVKAKGLVRLRSPGSVGSTGRVSTPISMWPFSFEDVGPSVGDLLEHVRELIAEEDGDDGRGRLVGPQPVVVGGRCDRSPQEAAVLVDRSDHRGAEHQELGVVVRSVARAGGDFPRSSCPARS